MTEKTEKIEYGSVWSKVLFTSEELRDIAEKLAIKTQELEAKESEKKAVMSSFKEMIEGIAMDIRRGARLYKDKYEMKDVECTIERNYDLGIVSYIRTDNGEIAKETKMTMGERQLKLDDALNQEKSEPEGKSEEEDYNPQTDKTNRVMAQESSSL